MKRVLTRPLRRALQLARPTRPPPICDDVREWAHAQGVATQELFPRRTFERSLPKTVEADIRAEYTSRLVGEQRANYLAPIARARLVHPHGLVVLPDGAFAVEPTYTREHLVSHPAYLTQRFSRAVTKPGTYYSLLARWSLEGNYYHWLHDNLARLYRAIDVLPPDTRYIVPADLSDFQRETLHAVGLTDAQLTPYDGSRVWELEVLYFAPPPTNSGSDRAEIDKWLGATIATGLGVNTPSRTRRIYLSRGDTSVRSVTNEAAVETLLREHGFENCVAGHLTMLEKVNIFSEAAAVVAPHGAGLANMLFAPQGLAVLDMIPTHKVAWAYTYWAMAVELGHDYWYFEAPSVDAPGKSEPDMEVPIDKLQATLDRWGHVDGR